jgi:hypothetical protein
MTKVKSKKTKSNSKFLNSNCEKIPQYKNWNQLSKEKNSTRLKYRKPRENRKHKIERRLTSSKQTVSTPSHEYITTKWEFQSCWFGTRQLYAAGRTAIRYFILPQCKVQSSDPAIQNCHIDSCNEVAPLYQTATPGVCFSLCKFQHSSTFHSVGKVDYANWNCNSWHTNPHNEHELMSHPFKQTQTDRNVQQSVRIEFGTEVQFRSDRCHLT